VTVTDLGKHPVATAGFVSTPGQVTYPYNAPTGGNVKVKATCAGLTCQLVSAPELPLTEQGRSGTWTWVLSAGDPGTAHIYLVEFVYRVNTSDPLSQTSKPIDIPVAVRAAPRPAKTSPAAQAPHQTAPPVAQAPRHSTTREFFSFLGDAEQQIFIVISIIGVIVGVVPETRKPVVAAAKKLIGKGGGQAEPPAADGSPGPSGDSA
jgi:hypothetical protein